jgi:hypothetical protein
MTVEELMRILRTYPADLRVVVDGYEEGYDDLGADLVSLQEIRLDAGEAWWEGLHRDAEDARREGSAIVNALALRRPMKGAR